ncbi:phosphoenolpyruvate--protein phosphotransferase [Brevibacterium samyangense]|uniref:Phosphoenolpyruvate-protein phosphotransferase n=1 Tax=Brevibacterium samyangense TaxID=366888 RepID=A0ABP5ETT4_9MICO
MSTLDTPADSAPGVTVYSGIGVVAGRVVAPVKRMPAPLTEPVEGPAPADPDAEKERIRAAGRAVSEALAARAEAVTGDAQAVLKATSLMAKDPMLLKTAAKKLTRTDAVRAVWEAGSEVAAQFEALGGYMAERVTDVLDVRARIIAQLRDEPAPGIPFSHTPYVLVAQDLAPADTATLDPNVVVALVCSEGGPQAHTAILARSLGLPAVVAAHGVLDIPDDTAVYVDGAAGTVTLDPGEKERKAAAGWAERAAALRSYTGPCLMQDGHRVPLRANVGTGEDARRAAAAGAEGVGLLRTEFCFLDRDTEPSREVQVAAYGEVFAAFPGRKVVVRTIDAGADKPLPFLTNADEPNPALGVRGYRTGRTHPGVLERQIEAIAEAAAAHTAEIQVMAPMIATVDEARAFADLVHSHGLTTAGVMIEVPSAALMSQELLGEVEFASIGTNDLTQYTMAADRLLGDLGELSDPWQPAVLKLIREAAMGGALNGASVGVCGEAAADPALAVVLVGMGITSLSMSPRALPAVAAVLRTVDMRLAKRCAGTAFNAPTAAEAREGVRALLPVLDELGI